MAEVLDCESSSSTRSVTFTFELIPFGKAWTALISATGKIVSLFLTYKDGFAIR